MENLILVDCDGVLLNWQYAFDVFMKSHGYLKHDRFAYNVKDQYGHITDPEKYIKIFNESASMGFLPPHRDAVYYVNQLHKKHGYVFHVISSFTTDEFAGRLRTMNLEKLFGENIFEKFIYLDTGADKYKALLPYKDSGCFFIEDKIENAEQGSALGLTSILMEHAYNMNYVNSNINIIKNWKEFYETIT